MSGSRTGFRSPLTSGEGHRRLAQTMTAICSGVAAGLLVTFLVHYSTESPVSYVDSRGVSSAFVPDPTNSRVARAAGAAILASDEDPTAPPALALGRDELVPLEPPLSTTAVSLDTMPRSSSAAPSTTTDTFRSPGRDPATESDSRAAKSRWKPADAQVAKAFARSAMPSFGWDPAAEFGCLDRLWMRESGWNSSARNSSSGAYGIPQSLPAKKMASAGSDWQTNPRTQIRWGLGYIRVRYGTPCAAWAHSQATGWY